MFLVKFGGRFLQILLVLADDLLLHFSHQNLFFLHYTLTFLVELEFNVLELPLGVLGVPLELVVNSRHKYVEVVFKRHALVVGPNVVIGNQFVLVVQCNLQLDFKQFFHICFQLYRQLFLQGFHSAVQSFA